MPSRVDDDPSPSVAEPPGSLDDDDETERGRGLSESQPSTAGEPLVVTGTDSYFVPLRLACESKLPRIMELALTCIKILIDYGYVRGKVVQVGKVRRYMIDVVMETICSCKDQEDESVQLNIIKAVHTAVASPVLAVHETTLLLAVKTCFYIYLVSRTPVIQSTANSTLTQMLNEVFKRLEFGPSNVSPSALSVIQRDAFLVFRSLCKLSMKPLPEPLPSDDSIELRSKLLSLQLLYSIIQNSGARFRSTEKFVWAVRQYLCVSLLKNGVSPIASILQLSLDLFVAVIRFFKDHLKSEIGVFFSNILLRILESSNSSGAQKQHTVQCLRTLVREPQLIVDLFVNYDCDLEATNILSNMCDGLSRLTISPNPLTDSVEQDASLKALSLETLVAITDSMVAWEREARQGHPPSSTRAQPAASVAEEPGGAASADTPAAPASAEGSSSTHSIVVAEADAPGPDFEAVFHRKAELQEGVIKFNMKPKKGMNYLCKVCGLENEPAAVAKFLLDTSGLDKRSVGEYLGEGDDFNKQVLYAYVDSLDFANTTFDAALRKFLSYFWLPGEAQKIDRMMEKFAERYCSQNDTDGVFANADTAYVLAYSLIMLNTDAHSSQVSLLFYVLTLPPTYSLTYLLASRTDDHSSQITKKMTQQEFVNMNRGINDGKDLPYARAPPTARTHACPHAGMDHHARTHMPAPTHAPTHTHPPTHPPTHTHTHARMLASSRSAFLEKLYQAITTNEIKIKEFDIVASRNKREPSGTLSRPNRSRLFHLESAAMVKESQEAFKLKAKRKSTYFSSRNVENVRPMFESTWCALLAACSAVMDDSHAEPTDAVVTLSLRGFANAVHIAADFGMATERDAFVTMLAKFTYLDSTKAMARRNIDSFTTLVQIALADGDGLGDSWAQVLKCLSEFQRLHMIGTGAKTSSVFFPASSEAPSPMPQASAKGAAPSKAVASSTRHAHSVIIQPTRPRQSTAGGGSREHAVAAVDLAAVDELNSATMLDKVDVVAIDRIFSQTEVLSPEAIVHFVRNLCAVSREELASPTDPQVYALQKLVEIAYYNMSRVRFVWARIWEVIGDFFTEVGQHANLNIANYAVDSLRQLSKKFLERGELQNFVFQREFLKPFVDLMGVATSLEMKELIITCLDNLVLTSARSIRSGWRPMFEVFSIAATDPAASVAEPGFHVRLTLTLTLTLA